jgi:hypothetical protein
VRWVGEKRREGRLGRPATRRPTTLGSAADSTELTRKCRRASSLLANRTNRHHLALAPFVKPCVETPPRAQNQKFMHVQRLKTVVTDDKLTAQGTVSTSSNANASTLTCLDLHREPLHRCPSRAGRLTSSDGESDTVRRPDASCMAGWSQDKTQRRGR